MYLLTLYCPKDGKTYHPWLAYAVSKSSQSLFSVALAKRLQGTGIATFALQPGSEYQIHSRVQGQLKINPKIKPELTILRNTVPSSGIGRNLQQEGPASFKAAIEINTARFGGVDQDLSGDDKTLESASSTILAAGLDPELEGAFKTLPLFRSGANFQPCVSIANYECTISCRLAESGKFLRNCAVFDIMPYALDPIFAEELWELSEKLVGQKFEV